MKIVDLQGIEREVTCSAWISDCQRYRYSLSRIWDKLKPIGVFVGLNPSTADSLDNDHTIRKEIGFSLRWGWGGFWKFNLFAFRTRHPPELWSAADPVGPNNDSALEILRNKPAMGVSFAEMPAGQLVAAWGAFTHKRAKARVQAMLCGPLRDVPLMCIGEPTKDGSPAHPLMLPYQLTLRPWRGLRAEARD